MATLHSKSVTTSGPDFHFSISGLLAGGGFRSGGGTATRFASNRK